MLNISENNAEKFKLKTLNYFKSYEKMLYFLLMIFKHF